MNHSRGAESPPPVEYKSPGVHRQRSSGVHSDQQRRLLWQSAPTGCLKPEVVLAENLPHGSLDDQQPLVGAFEGVLGGAASGAESWILAAGLAFYLALAELCEFSYGRTVLPVWSLAKS
jgi:hypothetical protein